ncbi:MAG TPA: hypothetical protein VG389_28100 [Myxococcota bacterium]|jgi:hypothetical protein|nr:hypothetical protein [Myxococcota bacterium]
MENSRGPTGSAALPAHAVPLAEMDEAWRAVSAGERLAEVRRAARALRERVLESGKVACVRTFDVSPAPYATRFGFAGAARSPVPYLVITNRVNVVQFETLDGELKTLLFNPTDAERSQRTPVFRAFTRGPLGRIVEWAASLLPRPKPWERLAGLGLAPEDVDYVAFDHLHTQDLRAVMGTDAPTPDEETPLRPWFPRAKLLVWRPEMEILRDVHPLQRYWYVPDCLTGVDPARIVPVERDLLLGRGVALVRTPGHTVGNWSLVLNTDSGVWAVSENGIACDAYAPEASAIPGLRGYARRMNEEVVLNSNTLELRNEQYTSMILEKTLVDRCKDNPDFYQHFPSSELTPTPLTPGLAPTYRHKAISSGEPRPAQARPAAPSASPQAA